ncbi:hypothetical protein [Trichocoleus sp. FACHB-591]|nr:hypothetical protein [Trichocoleus sp. FACHB-591]
MSGSLRGIGGYFRDRTTPADVGLMIRLGNVPGQRSLRSWQHHQ